MLGILHEDKPPWARFKNQWHSGWEERHEAFGKTFLDEVFNFRNVINAPPETTSARTRRRLARLARKTEGGRHGQ